MHLSDWNIVKVPLRKCAQCSPLCSWRVLELWDVWKWMEKKNIYGWNEVKCRLRIGKKKRKKPVKNCCWLLDENEDICVDLEGYIDTKALPSPSAVQQSLSRENPGFTQLVTLLILFLSSIHDCLPHPLLTMWHIYLFSLKFNRAQMQSQQTNKFPPSQVEVSAPLQVKAKCFLLLPNCLICDVQSAGVFTLSQATFETLVFFFL